MPTTLDLPGVRLLAPLWCLSLHVATLFAVALPASALAAGFTVNSTQDLHDANPGDGVCRAQRTRNLCTLRAALEETNALAGVDGIQLPAGVYILTLGQLEVTDSVTIQGVNTRPVIDAAGQSRVLRVEGSLQMAKVVVRNGYHDWGQGGGINVGVEGYAALWDCTVEGNGALFEGSGIYNAGYVHLYRTTVRDNANLSSFEGGGVTAIGGGVFNTTRASMVIEQSAIVRNWSLRGGGIGNRGQIWMTDSTVSRNEALSHGGGIVNYATDDDGNKLYGDIDIFRSTITENELVGTGDDQYFGGAGIANFAQARLQSTILAGNIHNNPLNPVVDDAPDCAVFVKGYFVSDGYNLIGTPEGCAFQTQGTDLIGTVNNPLDPELGPLILWGATSTELHQPQPGSPAIHNGVACAAGCSYVDQRGASRAGGTRQTDIGAFETDGVGGGSNRR